MNEKIKELAKESGIASFLLNGTVVSPWVEDTDIGDYVENFAELIINECISCLRTHGEYAKNSCSVEGITEYTFFNLAVIVLKEHFEVKENERKN